MADPRDPEEEYRKVRPVKVDTLDDVVHVSLGAWVHRHLVCDASEELRKLVVDYETKLEASTPRLKSRTASRNRVAVLPKPFECRRALELWSGFLYGQPIWTLDDEHDVDADFDALIEVYHFTEKYKHLDAQDASIDAIRDIIRNYSTQLESPFTSVYCRGDCTTSRPVEVLLGHVAYGKCAVLARDWLESFVDSGGEKEPLAIVEHQLCSVLLAKGEAERTGEAPRDSMERCKYHSHAEQGLPCYLDK